MGKSGNTIPMPPIWTGPWIVHDPVTEEAREEMEKLGQAESAFPLQIQELDTGYGVVLYPNLLKVTDIQFEDDGIPVWAEIYEVPFITAYREGGDSVAFECKDMRFVFYCPRDGSPVQSGVEAWKQLAEGIRKGMERVRSWDQIHSLNSLVANSPNLFQK